MNKQIYHTKCGTALVTVCSIVPNKKPQPQEASHTILLNQQRISLFVVASSGFLVTALWISRFSRASRWDKRVRILFTKINRFWEEQKRIDNKIMIPKKGRERKGFGEGETQCAM